MSNPMLTPHDKWQSFKCDCVYQNGLQLTGKHEAMCDIPMGYLTGKKPPNYPVPARLIEFDYWPATSTNSGRHAFYGHDYYKPGRWFEFLTIE